METGLAGRGGLIPAFWQRGDKVVELCISRKDALADAN